jgi:hypothetical protein
MADRGRLIVSGYPGGMSAPLPLVPMLREAWTVRAHSIFRVTSKPASLGEAVAFFQNEVARGVPSVPSWHAPSRWSRA